MDSSEAFEQLQKAQRELLQVKTALKECRAKLSDKRARVEFLENLIAEYAKSTRRPNREEWTQVTPRLRFAVLLRDNFRCTYCGASAEDGAELTVDHVIPRSAGGKTVIRNLRSACVACNRGKGATLLDLEAMAYPSRPLSAAPGESSPDFSGAGRRPEDSATSGATPPDSSGTRRKD